VADFYVNMDELAHSIYCSAHFHKTHFQKKSVAPTQRHSSDEKYSGISQGELHQPLQQGTMNGNGSYESNGASHRALKSSPGCFITMNSEGKPLSVSG